MWAEVKWWPGGMALSANMVVLMAQVVINGKKLGPHPCPPTDGTCTEDGVGEGSSCLRHRFRFSCA